ncbi:MAG: phytanoyl-CoA dioxygenase family protein [Alphaproteobacteria bacterium]
MTKYKVWDRIDTDVKSGVEGLKENGITCLRGFPDADMLETLITKTNEMLKSPSVYGSQGYYQKDRHKKIYEAFLLGEETLSILLDDRILDIVEGYLGSKILIQEMIVKNDLGGNELYFPMHAHTGSYRTVKNQGPFSVGIMLYTHDTEQGAFCFSPGTHSWNFPHGSDPYKYPEDMQKKIFDGMRLIAGKKGDIVLFDHRGFHGPQQPVTAPRTVFLGGFHNASDHGNKTKCPVAVYTTDLRVLNARQQEVLGIYSDGAIIPKEKLHYNTFQKDNPFAYKTADNVVKGYFKAQSVKGRVRNLMKGK